MQLPQHELLKIKIDNYSGPLEVLLDLAKTQKVDLTNISVTQLADQFIEFINSAKKINLDLASEYLLMATWLAYLKSKLLLPQDDEDNFKRRVDKYLFESKDSSIPIESGANKSRPGHAYLHYEFMTDPQPKWQPTPSKDSPYGTPHDGNKRMKANKIATIQLYKFNIHSLKEQGDELLLEKVPYFRLYIPKILGKGFRETKN